MKKSVSEFRVSYNLKVNCIVPGSMISWFSHILWLSIEIVYFIHIFQARGL